MTALDLNCDLGEGESDDVTAALMGCISSASIACGGHAGDAESMRRCLRLSATHGVRAGAHPGLTENFGRGSTDGFSAENLTALLDEQVGRLAAIARAEGVPLRHIKLHGSLYWATERDPVLCLAFLDWLHALPPNVAGAFAESPVIFAFAGGKTQRAARSRGIPVWGEAFADRAYRANGQLVPRDEIGAVIHDEEEVADRIRQLISTGSLPSVDGPPCRIDAQTLCVHGDSPEAVAFVRRIAPLVRGR